MQWPTGSPDRTRHVDGDSLRMSMRIETIQSSPVDTVAACRYLSRRSSLLEVKYHLQYRVCFETR